MDERPSRKPISPELDYDFLAMAADGEPVLDHVEGLGAALVVTATRAIVVRQGAHFRPRNGVRGWPLHSLRDVRLVPPRHGNGRLVIRTGAYPWQAVSLFVAAQEWPAAERVVGQIRVRLAKARRASPVTGATSPEPADRDR